MRGEADGSLLATGCAILRSLESSGPTTMEGLCLALGIGEGQCKIALAWLMCRELVTATGDGCLRFAPFAVSVGAGSTPFHQRHVGGGKDKHGTAAWTR